MCTREEDLAEWEAIEKQFGELLLQRNPWAKVEYSTWAFSDWDLLLTKQDESQISFEVKFDRMSSVTGNIAIEISCNGHPSWIMNSSADYFIYYFDSTFYSIARDDLIYAIRDRQTIFWWDWYRAELVLVPKETFISRCAKVWH